MLYAWTPNAHVGAWLSENILEDVKRNLIRTVTNSVNVLCITLPKRDMAEMNLAYHLKSVLIEFFNLFTQYFRWG